MFEAERIRRRNGVGELVEGSSIESTEAYVRKKRAEDAAREREARVRKERGRR